MNNKKPLIFVLLIAVVAIPVYGLSNLYVRGLESHKNMMNLLQNNQTIEVVIGKPIKVGYFSKVKFRNMAENFYIVESFYVYGSKSRCYVFSEAIKIEHGWKLTKALCANKALNFHVDLLANEK